MFNTKMYLENTSEASDPVVSSVEDMALFLKELLTNDNLANEAVRNTLFGEDNLITLDANRKIGLGIMLLSTGGKTIYTYDGINFGYHAVNAYIEESQTSITIFMNCSNPPFEVPPTVCRDSMTTLFQQILENEL